MVFPNTAEVIGSAVIGEIASRSISFLIKSWSDWMALPPTEEEGLDSLRRLLLRVSTIVEDAEDRCITSQAMLQQLNTMRQVMHRGHFTFDSIRCQAHERDKPPTGYKLGHHSFALSKFNLAKRLCICNSSGESARELRQVLAGLETILQDAAEFVMLSGTYPRLVRQPYSMYLLLDKCMFGRQMEMESIINFLLHGAQDPGAEHLGVLPIVGQENVGKSTLVEHACMDERVRNHFSQIIFLSGGDLSDEDTVNLAKGASVIKHENKSASCGGRVLIIIELDRDISEDLWQRLYSGGKFCFAHGSKIIVTSRSDKILRFGTTLPLRLQLLNQEAYWYYFKVRSFGSVDVMMEHPKVASIAMEMAREMSGCSMATSIFGGMLQSSFDVGSWSLALATFRDFRQRNRFICPSPIDPWEMSGPEHLPTVKKTSPGYFVVVKKYQTPSAHGDSAVPTLSVQDVMFGSARPQGKFAALAWRSHIPPHYNYVVRCELRMPKSVVSRKKRIQKISGSRK